jgi:hypothetical protein
VVVCAISAHGTAAGNGLEGPESRQHQPGPFEKVRSEDVAEPRSEGQDKHVWATMWITVVADTTLATFTDYFGASTRPFKHCAGGEMSWRTVNVKSISVCEQSVNMCVECGVGGGLRVLVRRPSNSLTLRCCYRRLGFGR